MRTFIIMRLPYKNVTKMPSFPYLLRKALSLFALFLVLWGQTSRAETVTVFAASSLYDAVEDIAEAYKAKSGDDVRLVFGATSAIARQVAQGAPADVVLLADEDWANWLVGQGAVPSVAAFSGNRLVLVGRDIAPIHDPAEIPELVKDGVLAMAQIEAVPAGRYGRSALGSLGIWYDLEPRVVQAANVRAALRFVQRGDAPIGIGYASDLVALPDLVEIYGFAPDTHTPIVYSGGVVSEQGTEFMAHILSHAGQDILAEWGFVPVDAQ